MYEGLETQEDFHEGINEPETQNQQEQPESLHEPEKELKAQVQDSSEISIKDRISNWYARTRSDLNRRWNGIDNKQGFKEELRFFAKHSF